MTFNIWLPIVINLCILGLLVGGVLIGRQHGVKVQGLKLLILCALGVGIYFLAPVITNAIVGIAGIAEAIAMGALTYGIINSFVILILFLIVYVIVSLIFSAVIIKKISGGKTLKNGAKRTKLLGINKKETRKLRKQQKQLEKRARVELIQKSQAKISTASRVFGAIFGALIASVFAFVLTLPLKPLGDSIAEADPESETITQGYEYTPFGQLDNATGIVEKIIK